MILKEDFQKMFAFMYLRKLRCPDNGLIVSTSLRFMDTFWEKYLQD